jgi:hypothetical protein
MQSHDVVAQFERLDVYRRQTALMRSEVIHAKLEAERSIAESKALMTAADEVVARPIATMASK